MTSSLTYTEQRILETLSQFRFAMLPAQIMSAGNLYSTELEKALENLTHRELVMALPFSRDDDLVRYSYCLTEAGESAIAPQGKLPHIAS